MRADPKPKPLDRSDEQRGVDGLNQVATNEYEPEGQIQLRGYASYLGALLYVLFGDVVTTAGAASGVLDPDGAVVPTGTHRHVFTKKTGVQPGSARLTMSYGDQWLQGRGVTLAQLAMEIAEDGVKGTADLRANYLSRLASQPPDTPSYDAFSILPWRRRNVQLTWGTGSTTIDSIAFTLAQALEYVHGMGNIANAGFPDITERANSPEGFLRLTGTMTRRQFDPGDWDALIAATAFALQIKMQSEQNIGATNKPYSLWILANAAQYTDDTLEGLKNQPRHQQELNWQAGLAAPSGGAHADADGKDFAVVLVNGTPAYE